MHTAIKIQKEHQANARLQDARDKRIKAEMSMQWLKQK
jgi:hypothetical protein